MSPMVSSNSETDEIDMIARQERLWNLKRTSSNDRRRYGVTKPLALGLL